MSLRPTLGTIKLPALLGLFGSRDQALIEAVKTTFEESVADSSEQDEAHRLIELLINEGKPAFAGKPENGTLQLVMQCVAEQPVCDLQQSDLIFWEEFCDAASMDEVTVGPQASPLLTDLVLGRPLVGSETESSWSFYSWLDRNEVALLFPELMENEDLQEMFEFDEACNWMQQILDAKDDVWLFAS